VLRRPEVVGGRVVDLEFRHKRNAIEVSGATGVSPVGAGGRKHPAAETAAAPLEQRIIRMLQLDVDTSEFLKLAGDSPVHEWVVAAKFGRLLCGPTVFEDIVKVITTTNTMWRQTIRMCELLVQKCGRESPAGYRTFPAPEDIARFSEAELKEDCRLGYRAKSIHILASGIASGAIDLTQISDREQSTEGLFESYLTLPGIGPYGAAHLLAMDGRHDFIAVDTEFRRFVRETYHRGRIVSDRTMLRRYSKWGRWKYLAYWSELWHSS
jgi:3-methyladenine DNA glycosylase/8-oxoguanine DNA glycosylase